MSLEFLNQLKNFEKLRNQNVFQGYSLAEFEKTLDFLGIKEKPVDCKRISIVGTNGKGSVAHFLSELAQENFHCKVGLYTSPHLLVETERIQVNGVNITYSEIQNFLDSQSETALNRLKNLSYFEFFTLLAMDYFRRQRCNMEIYEAGLGGRLDATKLVEAETIVLTKIGLDHTAILGDTKEKILFEKLQIATAQAKTIFFFPQNDSKLDTMILNFGKEKGIQTICFDSPFSMSPQIKESYLSFNLHYAAFILENVYKLKVSHSGVSNPRGRMEILQNNPLFIFDVGHNPDAILNLLMSIEKEYGTMQWDVVLGTLPDKDTLEIYSILEKWNYKREIFFFTKPPFFIPKIPNLKTHEDWSKKNPTIITGSFRLYEIFKTSL